MGQALSLSPKILFAARDASFGDVSCRGQDFLERHGILVEQGPLGRGERRKLNQCGVSGGSPQDK